MDDDPITMYAEDQEEGKETEVRHVLLVTKINAAIYYAVWYSPILWLIYRAVCWVLQEDAVVWGLVYYYLSVSTTGARVRSM